MRLEKIMKHAKEFTDKLFVRAVDGSPTRDQVEQAISGAMEFTKSCTAEVAKMTHKLKHLEDCRCKRCREVEKIVAAIQAWGEA